MEGMPKHASSLSETMNLAGGDDTHIGGCRGLWESHGYVVFTLHAHATTQQRRAGSGFSVARENRLVHFSCPLAR